MGSDALASPTPVIAMPARVMAAMMIMYEKSFAMVFFVFSVSCVLVQC